MKTYLNFSDLPEEMQKALNENKVFRMGRKESFISKYFLVYGTLRWGLGNWSYHFKGKTKHVGTFRLPGFLKSLGISCQYTGNPEHHTVFDLFEVQEEFLHRVNDSTDSLEGIGWGGGYEACAVKIDLEDGPIVAKFYESQWTNVNNINPERIHEDYALEGYTRNQEMSDFKKRMNYEAPAAVKFYEGKIDLTVKAVEIDGQ